MSSNETHFLKDIFNFYLFFSAEKKFIHIFAQNKQKKYLR